MVFFDQYLVNKKNIKYETDFDACLSLMVSFLNSKSELSCIKRRNAKMLEIGPKYTQHGDSFIFGRNISGFYKIIDSQYMCEIRCLLLLAVYYDLLKVKTNTPFTHVWYGSYLRLSGFMGISEEQIRERTKERITG